MSDLVERLRSWKQVRTTPYPIGYYLDAGIKAADEIERLRAEVAHWKEARSMAIYAGDIIKEENDRLRAALQKIAAIENQMVGPDWEEIDQAREIAKAALGGEKS